MSNNIEFQQHVINQLIKELITLQEELDDAAGQIEQLQQEVTDLNIENNLLAEKLTSAWERAVRSKLKSRKKEYILKEKIIYILPTGRKRYGYLYCKTGKFLS